MTAKERYSSEAQRIVQHQNMLDFYATRNLIHLADAAINEAEEGKTIDIIARFNMLKIDVVKEHMQGSIDRMKAIIELIDKAIELCKEDKA